MPIGDFSLEDLTATLQVPIPGIPGAYGEIEINGNGTATLALGAEVPVPFLDDYVNGEIQLEIDKEGEIAYGIEINLVGLSLEAMVRGCDVVVDLGYGVLGTQAVFPIPNCEKDEPEPEPEPEPELPDDRDDYNEKFEEFFELPNLPPETKILCLVRAVRAKTERIRYGEAAHTQIGYGGEPDVGHNTWAYSEQMDEAKMNVSSYRPDKGTELWTVEDTFFRLSQSNYSVEPYIREGRYTGDVMGWINGKTVRPVNVWAAAGIHFLPGSDIVKLYPYAYAPYREYFSGGDTLYVGTVEGLAAEMAAKRNKYRKSYLYATKRTEPTGDDIYWDGMASFIHRNPGEEPPRGNYKLISQSRGSYTLWYKEKINYTISITVLDADEAPPLQGQEPPIMDKCCKNTLRQLRELKKEIKEIKGQFTEPDGLIKEIHTAVAPAEFVETILPVELDKNGKEIKRDKKKAITLPKMLQAIGKTVGLEIPTEYFQIPDTWKPKSWTHKVYSKTADKLLLPETKTVPLAFAFKAISHFMYKISYVLDPDDIKFSRLPTRFVKPGAKTNEYEFADNYPELLAYLFQAIDNYGFHPFAVKVDDTNLSMEGDQPKHTEYLSQSAALQHLITEIEDINAESNAQLEILVRLAYEIGLCHTIGADNQQKLQNLQDFLGFEIKKTKKPLKMAFNPLAGESAINAAEKNKEEELEQQLPGFLNNTQIPIVVDEFSCSKTMIDFLLEILNAARQKQKGNRWG